MRGDVHALAGRVMQIGGKFSFPVSHGMKIRGVEGTHLILDIRGCPALRPLGVSKGTVIRMQGNSG